jgi:hypothetical protein
MFCWPFLSCQGRDSFSQALRSGQGRALPTELFTSVLLSHRALSTSKPPQRPIFFALLPFCECKDNTFSSICKRFCKKHRKNLNPGHFAHPIGKENVKTESCPFFSSNQNNIIERYLWLLSAMIYFPSSTRECNKNNDCKSAAYNLFRNCINFHTGACIFLPLSVHLRLC